MKKANEGFRSRMRVLAVVFLATGTIIGNGFAAGAEGSGLRGGFTVTAPAGTDLGNGVERGGALGGGGMDTGGFADADFLGGGESSGGITAPGGAVGGGTDHGGGIV